MGCCASLRDARRKIPLRLTDRYPSAQMPRSRSKRASETRLAGGDRAADRRWRRHERDYAANRQIQDLRLAVAGTFYGGRSTACFAIRRVPRALSRRARRSTDARRPSRRDQPLDGRLDGEGGGAEREFGSTHLARPRTPAAPGSPVSFPTTYAS